jgi:hypothetical protein
MNNNTVDTTIGESASDILGQFYCAFGLGAGPIRIQRAAIAALRARYAGPIQASIAEWEQSAPHVLSFLTQVGRLAALLATQNGRTSVSAADFTQARQTIEAGVHQNAENSGKLFAGPFCPPVPGELPAPPKSETPDAHEPVDRTATISAVAVTH